MMKSRFQRSLGLMHPFRSASLLFTALFLSCVNGCCLTQVKWVAPRDLKPLGCLRLGFMPDGVDETSAEELYSDAIKQENAGSDSCVDTFYQVARLTRQYAHPACERGRMRELHVSSVRRMIETSQRFGRFDPCHGFHIRVDQQMMIIPISYHGFVWKPSDFHQLHVVGSYRLKEVSRKHRSRGIGVPLVVTRHGKIDQELLPTKSAFSATVTMGSDHGFDLYDPLRIKRIWTTQGPEPLALDLTAPLAFQLRGQTSSVLEDFINPASSEGESRLYAIEPYQAQKTPLILVHGLLSNRFAWSEMVNELLASPGFVDRFQIWVFEYPTGRAFLTSAANFREKLAIARQRLDPYRQDPALSQMILVGHSMGGLISKLQVTCSGDSLWRSVSSRRLDEINASPTLLGELNQSFFFGPSPDVSRVIFLGTPHRGSAYARRWLGRVASSLVSPPAARNQLHRQLIDANPGAFSEELARRIPTSIDLLNPSSPLLNAMADLPVRQGVQMHSVIGSSCLTLKLEASDGVVPVSSAREPRAISERVIMTRHGRLNDHPKAIEEVLAILNVHQSEAARFTTEARW